MLKNSGYPKIALIVANIANQITENIPSSASASSPHKELTNGNLMKG